MGFYGHPGCWVGAADEASLIREIYVIGQWLTSSTMLDITTQSPHYYIHPIFHLTQILSVVFAPAAGVLQASRHGHRLADHQ